MSFENSDCLHKGDILVVEDDSAALKFMLEILTNAGYNVRPASDGELALRSVKAKHPDLILLDINLPDLNGIEVCHRLKADPATKDLPIIFISSIEGADLKVKALEAGGVDYVTKPVEASEVLARIHTHLTMYRMQQNLVIQSERLIAEINERELIEKELEKHKNQLEDLVEKRTKELKQEILEHKQAREELQLSNNRFQKLFNDSPVPLWEEDFSKTHEFLDKLRKKGVIDFRAYFEKNPSQLESCAGKIKILNMNQAALELHGAKNKKELLGNLDKIFTVNSFKSFKEEIIAIASEQHEFEIEAEVKTISGEKRHVLLKLIMDTEKQDSAIALVSTTDVTEYLNLKSRLQQAQKMESIGTLAGGIAHDFNNILYPIIGFAEMLKEDLPPDSPEYESAQEIYNAGRRGGELVKQILAFSRQTEHKLAPVRFQKILTEVCKLTRSTIPSDIEIHLDIKKDCGFLMAEATQMHQIAMNLITNAYHAVEKASGKISIQLKEIILDNDDLKNSPLRSGQYVMLSVSDNGVGIPREIMNNIFEPYFTTKEKGKGTGLGLAVVHGIVKEHKGDIKVYSEDGKGTTFNVYLPLMNKSTEPISTEKELDKLTGTERILLVDDEESIVRLEKQMLERLGYNVSARSDSLEALETFNSNPDGYDLVVSDMTMPNMTGDQLAKELMSIRPDIPIIICTGFSERINKEQAEANKIKGFLMKPVVKSEMAQMVRKVLDEAKVYKGN